MAQLILTYHLRPGVAHETYQAWVRNVDYPTMRGLKRVASYTNYRVEKQATGDAPLPFSYMELFDIPDMAGFLAEDMGSDVVQKVMGEFMGHVENPNFLLSDAVV